MYSLQPSPNPTDLLHSPRDGRDVGLLARSRQLAHPPRMNSAICLLCYKVLTGFCGFCSVLFCFLEFLVKGKRDQKVFWLQLSAHFWLLSNAKASRIQEFVYWCQQESTDPNKGARTWTAVLARDQQEARETMLLSHHRSSCYKPFLGTRLLLRFLGAD